YPRAPRAAALPPGRSPATRPGRAIAGPCRPRMRPCSARSAAACRAPPRTQRRNARPTRAATDASFDEHRLDDPHLCRAALERHEELGAAARAAGAHQRESEGTAEVRAQVARSDVADH